MSEKSSTTHDRKVSVADLKAESALISQELEKKAVIILDIGDDGEVEEVR